MSDRGKLDAADARRIAWAALFAFGVVFLGGITGTLEELATSCRAGACDWSAAGSALAGLAAAGAAAAFSAVKNALTGSGSRIK